MEGEEKEKGKGEEGGFNRRQEANRKLNSLFLFLPAPKQPRHVVPAGWSELLSLRNVDYLINLYAWVRWMKQGWHSLHVANPHRGPEAG